MVGAAFLWPEMLHMLVLLVHFLLTPIFEVRPWRPVPKNLARAQTLLARFAINSKGDIRHRKNHSQEAAGLLLKAAAAVDGGTLQGSVDEALHP